ncbi:oxidoreductase [Streptomyces neyagawaensis]|uniref:oxidoreductase n=1 Tax=Streptomyces neyagawaensis TaxID=42238 RepID=UPI001F0B5877|nr:oxidoreductase [Streptomyces neyagawaensis]MCL6732264.1 oxidoreductase [Streptomyces neyagawaensis]
METQLTSLRSSSSETVQNQAAGDDVVARIRELAPLLRRNATQGEQDRRVAPESIAALQQAGAFRIAVPRRHGGLESSLRGLLDVSAAVAEADGGTSWVVTLSNVNAWAASLFPGPAIDEVFADGPDTILSGVVTPSGTAHKVDGGYRVSGTWAYASASLHSSWAACGVLVQDENGETVDQAMVMIPRADYRVEDTWHVAGMRASGSNTIVAADVFVPEHRVLSVVAGATGANVADHPESPSYRSAVAPMLVMVLVGPQLGMARAALDLVLATAPSKALAYTTFTRQADSVAFQLLVAEAALTIDTAHLHAYRAADDVQRYAVRGEFPDLTARARIRGDAAIALRSVNKALNILLDANGAGSFAEVNALQRIWRDSNVAARHAFILPQVSLETYGKALLGVTEHIAAIV